MAAGVSTYAPVSSRDLPVCFSGALVASRLHLGYFRIMKTLIGPSVPQIHAVLLQIEEQSYALLQRAASKSVGQEADRAVRSVGDWVLSVRHQLKSNKIAANAGSKRRIRLYNASHAVLGMVSEALT